MNRGFIVLEKIMNKILVIFLLCFGCIACGPPRPMTFEEQQIYMAKEQCKQSASDMTSGWDNSSNPYWDAYFVMCMKQFGISNEALRHMWY